MAPEELLLIYKHKERVVPTESELRLFLSSWVQAMGPALYWILKSGEQGKLLHWLRSEEGKEDLHRDEKVAIVILRRKLGESPLVEKDYEAFRHYQLSAELASLILEDPQLMPRQLLLSGLRHLRDEVKNACKEAIALRIRQGEWDWVSILRKSASPAFRRAYESLIRSQDVPIPSPEIFSTTRSIKEFALLKQISLAHSPAEARLSLRELRRLRPSAKNLLLGKALAHIRQGKVHKLLAEASKAPTERTELLLAAFGEGVDVADFGRLLSTYEKWSDEESVRDERPAAYLRNAALADAIVRSTKVRFLPALRRTLRRIPLKQSTRGLAFALFKQGNLGDYRLVLDRIGRSDDPIDFLNHTELGHTIALRLAKTTGRVPPFLRRLSRAEEFWGQYIHPSERRSWPKKKLLPIKNAANRQLYIRLVGYGIIGSAKSADKRLLSKLATHSYGLIARAAAISLVRVMGGPALEQLALNIEHSLLRGKAEDLADAIRFAEIEHFGLATLW